MIENKKKHNVPLSAAISAGALTAGLDTYLTPKSKRNFTKTLSKSGLAALGTYGISRGLSYRLNRVNTNSPQVQDFTKVASDYTGYNYNVLPLEKRAYAATLYTSIEKDVTASDLLSMYESVTPGLDKVAMEMVIANYLSKKASLGGVATKALTKLPSASKSFTPKPDKWGKVGAGLSVASTGSELYTSTNRYNDISKNNGLYGRSS